MIPTSEIFTATLRGLRTTDRFAVGRRILSMVALGVLSAQLEPIARRTLRESASAGEMEPARATLLALAEAVETRTPALAGVLSLLVNDAIHSRSLTETLTGAYRVVAELGAGIDLPVFGAWFNLQLDEIVSVGPTGDIGTSRAMGHLLVSLAQIESGQTVYDPCCGLGGLLAHALDAQPDIRILGQEIHPISWALANLRLHLLGAKAEIKLGDSLVGLPPRADRILCDPPFGPLPSPMSATPHYLGLDAAVSRRSFESAFVTHCLAAMTPNGRAAILVSEAFLARRGAEEDLRRFLIEENMLEGIVSVPSKVTPWVSHELAAIVLRGGPAEAVGVRMVDAGRVAPGLKSRSRLDWSPMRAVTAAYFNPDDTEGVATVSPQSVMGPGRFRPAQHFVSTLDRPSLPDLLREAVAADAEADVYRQQINRLLDLLDLSSPPS